MAQPQAPGAQNLEKDLGELERKLGELKTKYDQYFLGLDKKEPIALREQVSNLVKKYVGMPIQNTGHKFRYTTLTSRYNAFVNFWNRTLREIEEGTYKRDQFKKKLHEADQDKPAPVAPAVPTAKTAASKDPMALLYQQYMEARKANKEANVGLSKEQLEAQLKKQAQAIKEKLHCKRVTFKVVVEDGKTKIKALPKND